MNEITKQLPFEITFNDIEQKLIKKEGPITAGNTIDWITRFTIKDETGEHEATAQMNRPFDYRGYRFFQASFMPVGRARSITVRATNESGEAQDVVIPRDATVALADGTRINFAQFRGNFRIGPEDPNEDTSAYPNPAAVLKVTAPNAVPLTAYAFGAQMASMPVAKKPVAGHTYQLIDFEKVSDQHILSVQRDPGANIVYIGFVLLFITLVAVFFFSYQRVWAVISADSDKACEVLIGGNTNRGQNGFEDKLVRLTAKLRDSSTEVRGNE
jgi:cytochrome c biogenesis protein